MFMLTALALSSTSRTAALVMREGSASLGIQLAPIMVISRPLTLTLKEWSISSFSMTHSSLRKPSRRRVTSPSTVVTRS
jgi:hypothetical protein